MDTFEKLQALLDLDEDGVLSTWEVDFIDSVQKQRVAGWGISSLQQDKINTIFDKI